jgi:hypothetical protein
MRSIVANLIMGAYLVGPAVLLYLALRVLTEEPGSTIAIGGYIVVMLLGAVLLNRWGLPRKAGALPRS